MAVIYSVFSGFWHCCAVLRNEKLGDSQNWYITIGSLKKYVKFAHCGSIYVLYILYIFSGVFSGALITALGLPIVSLMASVLVPFGFISSFFITNIHFLYITIGIISGNYHTL